MCYNVRVMTWRVCHLACVISHVSSRISHMHLPHLALVHLAYACAHAPHLAFLHIIYIYVNILRYVVIGNIWKYLLYSIPGIIWNFSAS